MGTSVEANDMYIFCLLFPVCSFIKLGKNFEDTWYLEMQNYLLHTIIGSLEEYLNSAKRLQEFLVSETPKFYSDFIINANRSGAYRTNVKYM
jgi:hypothetical protein